MTDANAPQIKMFREILIWPFKIAHDLKKDQEKDRKEDYIDEWLSCGGWQREPDLLYRGVSGPHKQTHYAEFVYFHPFVQRFFYGKDSPRRIYTKTGIKSLRIILNIKCPDAVKRVQLFESMSISIPVKCLDLAVARIQLHLFHDMGIALFVMEVGAADLDIKVAEDLLDQLRRAYPPYWENCEGGHCPVHVSLHDAKGTSLATGGYALDKKSEASYLDAISSRNSRNTPQPTVAEHWEYLLNPFTFSEKKQDRGRILCRHIVDDRIPHMAFLAADNLSRLTEGDLVRLGLADEGGPSETLPYAKDFLQTFTQNHCYDRFWEPEDVRASMGKTWKHTRYVITDYSFTVFGQFPWDSKEQRYDETRILTNPETGLLSHFRHHYLQMGILLFFHKATLLTLSDSISEAVNTIDSDRDKFQDEIHVILDRLLRFTNRYWFEDISNQVQGQELFHLWRRNMRTPELYAQVSSEAKEVNEHLETEYAREQMENVSRLTILATFGMLFSLAMAFVQLMKDTDKDPGWSWFGFSCIGLLLFFFLLYSVSDTISVLDRRWRKTLTTWKKARKESKQTTPMNSEHKPS